TDKSLLERVQLLALVADGNDPAARPGEEHQNRRKEGKPQDGPEVIRQRPQIGLVADRVVALLVSRCPVTLHMMTPLSSSLSALMFSAARNRALRARLLASTSRGLAVMGRVVMMTATGWRGQVQRSRGRLQTQ